MQITAMLISYFCLIVIFACFATIICCKRIHTDWVIKLIMCIGMIGIIGIFANHKQFEAIVGLNIFLVSIAILGIRVTSKMYMRGEL